MSLNFWGDYSDTKRPIHTFLGFCEVCEAVLGVDILVWGKKNHSILRESSMLLNNVNPIFTKIHHGGLFDREFHRRYHRVIEFGDKKPDRFFNYLEIYWVHVSFKKQNPTFNVT